MNLEKVEAATKLLLEALEVDTTDHNFDLTPKRVAKVYAEIFAPADTEWPVFDEKYTDIVLLRGHEFYTMCPHHLLPVRLVASVGYLPNGKVLGASKLARVLHDCNRHPMTQEALTDAVVKRLQELTVHTSLGEAVYMEGEHGCFRIRGVHSAASMITYKFSGSFQREAEMQRRFLELVRR